MGRASSAPTSVMNNLITAKSWSAVIERCATHPIEVGSGSPFRNERGYTALQYVPPALSRLILDVLTGLTGNKRIAASVPTIMTWTVRN